MLTLIWCSFHPRVPAVMAHKKTLVILPKVQVPFCEVDDPLLSSTHSRTNHRSSSSSSSYSVSLSVPPPCSRSHGTQKKPGHSAKSVGVRLHLNTHTPLTQRSRSGLTKPLSRHIEGLIIKRAQTQLIREHLVTVVSAR